MMEIKNLMEDAVKAVVDELFDSERSDPRLGYCTCDQCRLDVACYVLNRVKPEYIVSSRGLAYSEREGLDKVQRRADVISLVKEGWSKVTHTPRPTSDHSGAKPVGEAVSGPAYNFPTFMGRVFDGRTFAPIGEGSVKLLVDGAEAQMVDPNWQNPFVLACATGGTYIFWPRPVPAPEQGGKRSFVFEFRISAPGFDPLSHFAEIELTPDKAERYDFSLQRIHKIPDLFLFPEGQNDEEDR